MSLPTPFQRSPDTSNAPTNEGANGYSNAFQHPFQRLFSNPPYPPGVGSARRGHGGRCRFHHHEGKRGARALRKLVTTHQHITLGVDAFSPGIFRSPWRSRNVLLWVREWVAKQGSSQIWRKPLLDGGRHVRRRGFSRAMLPRLSHWLRDRRARDLAGETADLREFSSISTKKTGGGCGGQGSAGHDSKSKLPLSFRAGSGSFCPR